MPDWRYKSRLRPLAAFPDVVGGTWTPVFHAERGDFPANPTSPFVFRLYVDGELVVGAYTAPAEFNYDGRGGQRVTATVDTTRFPDGPRLVTAHGYPAEPEPGGIERWHARWEGLVTFRNGATAMALLPSAQQCVVHDGAAVTITAQCLHCDGTTHPAGFLSLGTDRPDRVAIDGDTLRVLTPGWATVTVRDEATGLAASIRVGRWPAAQRALPHLGRDWSVKRAVDDASRWVVAPFYLSIRDAMGDPKLAGALAEAGLLTFWHHVGPNVGTRTLAQYKDEWERSTEGYWPFLERTGADVYLVFDEIGRTRAEARRSLDNPLAAEAYAWAIAQWRTRARGFAIRVIDEVGLGYGGDPRPADRRWDHFAPPVAVAESRDGVYVRTARHDWSRVPVRPPPADGNPNSDLRPRLWVQSGAHAGRWSRIARGDASGELTLAVDAAAVAGGFDARTMRLVPGDIVLVTGSHAGPDSPLPDDTFVRLTRMLRAGGVPFGFPVGPYAPADVLGQWARIGDVADVYTHLLPGDDIAPSPHGPTLPQGRRGREHAWHAGQDAIDPAMPFMALVSGTGPYYSKRSNRRTADYDPDVDALHIGGRARYTAMHLALALVGGACGASVYFFDDAERRRTRERETHPRTLLPEAAQTGFHPFARGTGGEIYRAVAAFRRLLDTLGPRVFAPLGIAPALGPALRASRRGDLLLVVNTRERPVTTVPLALGRPATRWRLVGERLTSEPLGVGGVRLTLEPGELSALVGVGPGV